MFSAQTLPIGFFIVLTLPTHAALLKNKVVLTGASTIAPLLAEMGKRFEAKHPGARIDVQSGGSSRGVADVRAGLADLGMVSRALKPDEKDLVPYTVALDGVTLIVNRANNISSLTDEQIKKIYTGEIKNWKEVGGRDAPITVVNKAEGRSTLELFLAYFKLKASDIRAHVVIGENQQGIKTVAGNKNAIGYVSIGSAAFDAKQGVPIRLLAMAGVEPTVENVRTGRFPLARPLNLVVKSVPNGLVKEFLDFTLSANVQDIVLDQFFVPLKSVRPNAG